ncbi:hypothetical protein [Sulfitobacter noctilucicola]|uniref:hypothetical protein n=1 Tax=Sulfitobacter noctilucicola TaxID=1342301 RepID=UPI0013646288|nr:hypothetical protein [Sulfitobacter noctilucicola]
MSFLRRLSSAERQSGEAEMGIIKGEQRDAARHMWGRYRVICTRLMFMRLS